MGGSSVVSKTSQLMKHAGRRERGSLFDGGSGATKLISVQAPFNHKMHMRMGAVFWSFVTGCTPLIVRW
jgi:hypothetical protein